MPGFLRIACVLALTGALAWWQAGAWPWNTDMVNQPAPSPGAGPRPPAPGTLPVGGEWPMLRGEIEQKMPNAPASPGDGSGARPYAIYCAPCHGPQGEGDGPVAAVFLQPGRLGGPEVQERNDGWIYGTVRNGSGAMPHYGPELPPAQRWQVVHFVRSLSR